MTLHFSRLAVVVAVCVSALASSVRAQAPTVDAVRPAAVTPGTSTDITLYGDNLAGATQLWTNVSAETILAPGREKNGTDSKQVTFRITAAADLPVGVAALRVVTHKGVSPLTLFLIDDLPSTADNGKNGTPATAQALSLPVAVDGVCHALGYDYFSFDAKKGQRVSVEVVARRLGSPLDPVVRLLDDAGRELAYSEDEPGLAADCRFQLRVPADGVYRIELRDARYEGSDKHRYRLRVGDFPLASVPFPLGVQRGESAMVAALGPAVEGVAARSVQAPTDARSRGRRLSFRYPEGDASSFVLLLDGVLPVQVEVEPNDTHDTATTVAWPAAIDGRFDKPGDRDHYRLVVKKGDKLRFAGISRTVGSACDLVLRLRKPDGAQLAEVDDTDGNEGVLTQTFDADGAYVLEVTDLADRGGPAYAYRIDVTEAGPGVSLSLESDTFNAPRGGTFVAKVTAQRREYDGPIRLRVEGVEATVAAGTIPKGKNETQLRVTLSADIEPGRLLTIRIAGTIRVGDADGKTYASTAAALRKRFARTPTVLPLLDGAIAVGVGPPFPDFFALRVESDKVPYPTPEKPVTIKVHAKRLADGFKGTITLAAENLPKGVEAEVKSIDAEKSEGSVTLKVAETLEPGTHAFRITGKAAFKDQEKTVIVGDLRLEAAKP